MNRNYQLNRWSKSNNSLLEVNGQVPDTTDSTVAANAESPNPYIASELPSTSSSTTKLNEGEYYWPFVHAVITWLVLVATPAMTTLGIFAYINLSGRMPGLFISYSPWGVGLISFLIVLRNVLKSGLPWWMRALVLIVTIALMFILFFVVVIVSFLIMGYLSGWDEF